MAFLTGLGGGGDGTVTITLVGNAAQLQGVLGTTMGQLKAVDSAGRNLGTSLGRGLTTVGSRLTSVGRTLTTHLTLPLVAVTAGVVKMAATFDQSMTNVASISDEGGAAIAKFGDQILRMAGDVAQAPDVLATGLYNIVSSGFDGAKAMNILDVSSRAAAAGMATTDVAAKAVTAALNSYGLGAGHAAEISDTLFVGVKAGVMTFDELAGSMGTYVGAAAELNIPLTDVVAAQAAMTLSGRSADEAGTQLSGTLRTLLAPSEALSKELKSMGFESGQAALESLGLEGTMSALADSVGNNKSRWAELFPEVRAMRGAMALTADEGRKFNDVLDQMADKAGVADKAFGKVSQGDMFKFQAAWQGLRAELIKTGAKIMPTITRMIPQVEELVRQFAKLLPTILDTAIPIVKDIVKAINDLPPGIKTTIAKFVAWGAILGPGASLLGGLSRMAGFLATIVGWLLKMPKNPWPKPPPGGIPGMPGGPGVPPVPVAGIPLWAAAPAAGAGAHPYGAGTQGENPTGGIFGTGTGVAVAKDLTLINQLLEIQNDLAGDANITNGKALQIGNDINEMLEQQGSKYRVNTGEVREAINQEKSYQEVSKEGVNIQEDSAKATKLSTYERQQAAFALTAQGRGLQQVNDAIATANQLSIKEKGTLLGLVGQLKEQRNGLNAVQASRVRMLALAGDAAGAERLLNRYLEQGGKSGAEAGQGSKRAAAGHREAAREADRARDRLIDLNEAGKKWRDGSPYRAKVDEKGSKDAGGKIQDLRADADQYARGNYSAHLDADTASARAGIGAAIGLANQYEGTYTAHLVTIRSGNRYTTAKGGIVAGASGLITRGPTILAGEGNYATMAGRGGEAVIPLNGRGINILSAALYQATNRRARGGGDGVRVTVNVNGGGSWDEDRLARAISRHIGSAMRERSIA